MRQYPSDLYNPEVASVGETEQSAREKGIDARTAQPAFVLFRALRCRSG